jgi:hypothetical protein
LVSPAYTAVTELVPEGIAVVGRMATPADSVAVPREVLPLKNVTVPDGVAGPVLAGVMVAVSVTLCPKDGVPGEAETVVVVVTFATVIVTAGDVLDVKVLSPEYTAVTALAPVARASGASEPEPPESVAVPSKVVPSKNETVPLGVPVSGLTGATVADNVTSLP